MPPASLQIVPFTAAHLPAAIGLLRLGLQRLRAAVPCLPPGVASQSRLQDQLAGLPAGALAVEQNGVLAGFLAWYIIPNFRDTGRTAALALEWMHAAAPGQEAAVYPLLYTHAADCWQAAGAQIHAVSLLANHRAAETAWFWSGFGLGVVDALRTVEDTPAPTPPGFTLRPALPADAPALAELEAEHLRHYASPPVLMPPRRPGSPADLEAFLAQPGSRIWLALHGDHPAAYLQFEAGSFGASELVRFPGCIAITGLYTRPEQRGRGLAAALLSAGLGEYAALGYTHCSVDFESFNPPAAAFWTRTFQPVSFSLFRVPENTWLKENIS
jgi:GNAT superfamily N-acetyltransferase